VQVVLLATAAILLYLAWAVRRLPHPFVYGGAALAALLHDVLVVLGVFAILGFFWGVRIDALFVPAVLTVIGFSVHAMSVVFDRIRENISRQTGEPYVLHAGQGRVGADAGPLTGHLAHRAAHADRALALRGREPAHLRPDIADRIASGT
jgi:fatty acid desaturase